MNFYQKGKTYFHLGVGGMFESERWQAFDDQVIEVDLFKSTNYVGAILDLGKHVNMSLTCYYQVGYYEEIDRLLTRLSGDLNLDFKITEKLHYVTNFRLQYESRPIIPINRVVYALTNGIIIKIG